MSEPPTPKPPPPPTKPRTIFDVPTVEGEDEEVKSTVNKGRIPPPRPPLPARLANASPIESPRESPRETSPSEHPSSYAENVVYLGLDTYRALDPSLSSSISPISPKNRPAPPPPPPTPPVVGWNISPVPPLPQRPLPPLPHPILDCSPSTSCSNSVHESTGSIDKTELADSFEVVSGNDSLFHLKLKYKQFSSKNQWLPTVTLFVLLVMLRYKWIRRRNELTRDSETLPWLSMFTKRSVHRLHFLKVCPE